MEEAGAASLVFLPVPSPVESGYGRGRCRFLGLAPWELSGTGEANCGRGGTVSNAWLRRVCQTYGGESWNMGHSFPGLVEPGEARHRTVQCSFTALISRARLALWKSAVEDRVQLSQPGSPGPVCPWGGKQ